MSLRVDPWKLVFAALALAGATSVYLLAFAQEGEGDWEAFKNARHCRSVGAEAGNNQGGWRCDDGQIHYRWRQQK